MLAEATMPTSRAWTNVLVATATHRATEICEAGRAGLEVPIRKARAESTLTVKKIHLICQALTPSLQIDQAVLHVGTARQ